MSTSQRRAAAPSVPSSRLAARAAAPATLDSPIPARPLRPAAPKPASAPTVATPQPRPMACQRAMATAGRAARPASAGEQVRRRNAADRDGTEQEDGG